MSDPLSQLGPNSLDELFSRDPADLRSEDLDIIVNELRRQRELWQQAESQGKRRAPRPSKGPVPTIEDLGL